MAKYFIVSTDSMTADQEKLFHGKIREHRLGWWHWLPNFWLILDSGDDLTAAEIRDFVGDVARSVRCMVLEVDPRAWAGRTRPDAQGRDMADWVKRNWPRSESD